MQGQIRSAAWDAQAAAAALHYNPITIASAVVHHMNPGRLGRFIRRTRLSKAPIAAGASAKPVGAGARRLT